MIQQETRKPGNPVDGLTELIIGAAIRVHRELGPGFLESIYEEALTTEFSEQAIQYEPQKPLPIMDRAHHVGEHRLDSLVENAVVVELKAVVDSEYIHFAIVRSHLKAADLDHALLMNFRNHIGGEARRSRVHRHKTSSWLSVSNLSWFPGFLLHP